MTDKPEAMFWYNLHTKAVEKGYLSPSSERVGPFATAHEAEHAMEKLRENSDRWEAEERAEREGH